jgi:hypothetical protein
MTDTTLIRDDAGFLRQEFPGEFDVAIEISGNYDTALDEKSRQAIVALTAYYADLRQIPWTEFPNVPGQDRSFVHWHNEFTAGTGKTCPGQVVMSETSNLIARVKEYLRGYQEMAAPPPEYAKPVKPQHGSHIVNDYVFLAPGGKTVQVDTAPSLWADGGSIATGPVIKAGTVIPSDNITHYVVGSDGDLWVVLVDGSRFPARSLVKA